MSQSATATATAEVRVRSLLLPIVDGQLLLPNAAVAEIVPYVDPEPLPRAPDWMLGLFQWRERRVPTLSFEAVCGGPVPPAGARARVAVINALDGWLDPPFYALVIRDLPHLVQVGRDGIRAIDDTGPAHAAVRSTVDVLGETAHIPSLDTLEGMLRNVLA